MCLVSRSILKSSSTSRGILRRLLLLCTGELLVSIEGTVAQFYSAALEGGAGLRRFMISISLILSSYVLL